MSSQGYNIGQHSQRIVSISNIGYVHLHQLLENCSCNVITGQVKQLLKNYSQIHWKPKEIVHVSIIAQHNNKLFIIGYLHLQQPLENYSRLHWKPKNCSRLQHWQTQCTIHKKLATSPFNYLLTSNLKQKRLLYKSIL